MEKSLFYRILKTKIKPFIFHSFTGKTKALNIYLPLARKGPPPKKKKLCNKGKGKVVFV